MLIICFAMFYTACTSNQNLPEVIENHTNSSDYAVQPEQAEDTSVQSPIQETKTEEHTPAALFDPKTVSAELKETTFFDVKALIQKLNTIIQLKDYNAWLAVLSPEYLEYYSSADTLARLSESPVLKRQGLSLHTLNDYFLNVVYPSRQNDRIDDIEFIAPNKIRAIIITVKGERLVLYNLEKIGDIWKIAYWR